MTCMREIVVEKKVPLTELKKEEAKTKLNKLYKEESKLVKGVFKNLEAPGGELEFPFRMFPQDPLRIYRFEDGKEYEVPLCVAKHLNNTCVEKRHAYLVDENGDKIVGYGKGKQRYQFLSTEFM